MQPPSLFRVAAKIDFEGDVSERRGEIIIDAAELDGLSPDELEGLYQLKLEAWTEKIKGRGTVIDSWWVT